MSDKSREKYDKFVRRGLPSELAESRSEQPDDLPADAPDASPDAKVDQRKNLEPKRAKPAKKKPKDGKRFLDLYHAHESRSRGDSESRSGESVWESKGDDECEKVRMRESDLPKSIKRYRR